MSGKFALIIANTQYSDANLAKLTAPGKDAAALAEILKAPDVCAFDDVKTLVDESEPVSRRAIAKFCANRTPDDLLLLYFSGHGIRDEQGRLFLATTDTDHTLLDATAIAAEFVTRQMDESRSRRQVLILDCCNSGAFAYGTKGATGATMGTASAFEGSGYGHVVLTATDATQFAWEGDRIIGEQISESVFTHFLVKGLEGEADRDGNGTITVDELYDYTYDQIVQRTSQQKPGKWAYKEQGKIILTSMIRPHAVKPLPLDPELEQDLESDRNYVRDAAVKEVGQILKGKNPGRALAAEKALQRVAEQDDSLTIRRMAAGLLQEYHKSNPVAPPVEEPAQPPSEESKESAPQEQGETAPPELGQRFDIGPLVMPPQEHHEKRAEAEPLVTPPREDLVPNPRIVVPSLWTRWTSALLNPRHRLALGMGSMVIVGIGLAAILAKFALGGIPATGGLPAATAAVTSASQATSVPPSASLAPSVVPSLTSIPPTPAVDLTDPQRFGEWFFTDLWTVRDFQVLWDTYLTAAYQEQASPGGFQEWAAWWISVRKIDIYSVDVLDNDGHYATIHVDLGFHLNDGRVLDHRAYTYQLAYSPIRKTWMFDFHP
jgi:hypothetical protein